MINHHVYVCLCRAYAPTSPKSATIRPRAREGRMNAPCLPWSEQQSQIFCHIVALQPFSIHIHKGAGRLLVTFNAVFETAKVLISDLKVYIRKSPVVSSEFQVVGVIVKDS